MANLLERLTGLLQPYTYPPAYLLMDAETSVLTVLAHETTGELALPICSSPAVAERYMEDLGWDTTVYRPSFPMGIRAVRATLAYQGDTITGVLQVRDDGVQLFPRAEYVRWIDEAIAKGAR